MPDTDGTLEVVAMLFGAMAILRKIDSAFWDVGNLDSHQLDAIRELREWNDKHNNQPAKKD
jgi:hypothetical protein